MFLLNTERVVVTCETSSVRFEDGYWQIALQQVCRGPGVLGESVSVFTSLCTALSSHSAWPLFSSHCLVALPCFKASQHTVRRGSMWTKDKQGKESVLELDFSCLHKHMPSQTPCLL